MKTSLTRLGVYCICTGIVMGCFGCASTSDVRFLDERLRAVESLNTDLKRENQNLEKQLSRAREQQNAREAELMNRYAGQGATVNAVREEMSRLEGILEELNHRDDLAAGAIDRVSAVLDRLSDRVAAIEAFVGFENIAGGRGEASAAQTPQPAVPTQAPTPPPAPATEAALYAAAKGMFDKGEMETARSMFTQFLDKYGKSPNADNAQFWIGETYYRENWFEKAILEYQEVIESYPKGNKVPSALLKQGFAFLKLGNRLNCQILLKDIIERFPNTPEAEIASKKLSEFD